VNVACPECRSVFRVDPTKLPASIVRARCAVCGGLITITPSSSVRDEFAPRTANEHGTATQLPQDRAGGYATGAAVSPYTQPPAPLQPPSPQAAPAAAAQSTFAPASHAPPAPFVATRPSPPVVAPMPPAAVPPTPHRGEAQPPAFPPSRAAAAESAAPNLGAATAAALFGRVEAQPAANALPPRAPGGIPPRAPSPARPAMPFVRPSPSGAAQPAPASGLTPFGVRATPPGGQGAPRRPINPFLANDPNAKARRLARALISDMITYFPEKREEGLRTGALKQLFEEEITKSYGEYVEQVGREFAESTPFFQEALNEILAGGRKLF
jgi:predicted Zn finger-like uncharacterized protein